MIFSKSVNRRMRMNRARFVEDCYDPHRVGHKFTK
jgi:hypothetical protein